MSEIRSRWINTDNQIIIRMRSSHHHTRAALVFLSFSVYLHPGEEEVRNPNEKEEKIKRSCTPRINKSDI